MFNIDLYSRTTPQHPNVIPISKILSSDIFACVVKQQHSVATKASLYRSKIDCVASLYSSRVFAVIFLQRHRLCCWKGFGGPVGGYQVVELPNPWLGALTCCRGCIARVWAVLCIGDGVNCVVVNRVKKSLLWARLYTTSALPPTGPRPPPALRQPRSRMHRYTLQRMVTSISVSNLTSAYVSH